MGHSREGGTFRLMEQQYQLPRLFTPETESCTGLLCHGTGTGKSGTIVRCALRFACLPNALPAVFLVPNDHVKNEIEYQILGREWINVEGRPSSFLRASLPAMPLSLRRCTQRSQFAPNRTRKGSVVCQDLGRTNQSALSADHSYSIRELCPLGHEER